MARIPFVPTIENECSNPFLPKSLPEIIENDVPIIIGYTAQEGSLGLFGNYLYKYQYFKLYFVQNINFL